MPCLRAASNTVTVPTTFTLAPATGSALQKGTCSAARWMIAQGRTSSTTRITVPLSEISPVFHAILPRSFSSISSRGRRLSSERSKAQACTPERARSESTQLPMQPPAPVTSTGPGKLARSTEKRLLRSFIRLRSMQQLPDERPTQRRDHLGTRSIRSPGHEKRKVVGEDLLGLDLVRAIPAHLLEESGNLLGSQHRRMGAFERKAALV